MKILVMSDSHGMKNAMLGVVSHESPDMILHLGDSDKDCSVLKLEYPDIPLRTVRGNCDRSSDGLDIDEFVLCGKRFIMTHGDKFHVKTGLSAITDYATARGADILLFGHTHSQHFSTKDNMTIINPGCILGIKEYAVLTLENGVVACDLKEL